MVIISLVSVAGRCLGGPSCRAVARLPAAPVALGLLLAGATGASAQATPCDPEIERNSKGGQLGYQKRGEHCEGLYETDVAALPVWIASFTESFERYDLGSTDPIVIGWTAPPGTELNLRAHGIKRDLYYRMDAPDRRGGAFEWTTDVLAAQGIERDQIGVLGWREHSVAGVQHKVLVPVRVAQPGAGHVSSGRPGAYELVLIPNVRLNEVYVTLARVDAVGSYPQGTYIKDREPLGELVYATQVPIRITLTGLDQPGIYFLEITIEKRNGRSESMEPIWIERPGE